MLPPLTPCRIHVHDTTAFYEEHIKASQRCKARWANDPFSTELSLQRAAAFSHHAEWRSKAAQADLIFVAANCRSCASGRPTRQLRPGACAALSDAC